MAFDTQKLKQSLAEVLKEKGVLEADAVAMAEKEVDSMGSMKTATGKCPKGCTSPLDCLTCSTGHMMVCHYPLTCYEANCIYQQRLMQQWYQYFYPKRAG